MTFVASTPVPEPPAAPLARSAEPEWSPAVSASPSWRPLDDRTPPWTGVLAGGTLPIPQQMVITMLPDEILTEAESLLGACRDRRIMLATAESCTGGLIAAALTAIPGSSDVVDRGFVTYSNDAKNRMIGVPMALIEAHGAVSEPVARAMAEGTLDRSLAAIAVSVTGVAGPGGGTQDKPVGLVCFGLARSGQPVRSERHVFPGDRGQIRAATVAYAFKMIRAAL